MAKKFRTFEEHAQPILCQDKSNKRNLNRTLPPLPVGGKHGPNWRISNFAGGGIRAGEFGAGEYLITGEETHCRFWIFFSAQFVNWWQPFHSILFVTYNSFSHSVGRNKDVTLVSLYLWMETNLFTEVTYEQVLHAIRFNRFKETKAKKHICVLFA